MRDGSFSDGLRMNVLPQAMALANIHIGTIAGKLNGRDPGDDAQRLADLVDVDAARLTCSLKPPLSRCGMPVANSRFSRPRATSPSASDGDLAVLGGQMGRDAPRGAGRPGSGCGT